MMNRKAELNRLNEELESKDNQIGELTNKLEKALENESCL